MHKTLILIIFFGILFSCSEDNNNEIFDDVKGEPVNIRLANSSNSNFENIIINTSTGNVSYNDLKSGELSEYKTFEIAYRIAFVELLIDGEILSIQPIDYVGSIPLSRGDYTYELDIDINSLGTKYLKLKVIQ